MIGLINQLWDLSVAGGSLVSSFGFSAVISHLGWDSLERFFIGATNSSLFKVNLYRKREEVGYGWTEAVGGGARGEVTVVPDQANYNSNQPITALHLSKHSNTLLIGTQDSAIQILALPSLLPTRIINPAPSNSSQSSHPTFITTITRTNSTNSHPQLISDSNTSIPPRPLLSAGLGRVIRSAEWATNGGQQGRTSLIALPGNPDLRQILNLARDRVNQADPSLVPVKVDQGGASLLEEELSRVRAQLAKAVSLNEAMWQKVVQAGLEQS